MDIQGAPTVYFYDGEDEITHIVAENGEGVGAYEDNYFSKISAPENPTKEGKTFAGWFYNGSEFDFNTVIKNPTVLQAHWTDAAPVNPDTPVDRNPDTVNPDTPAETITVIVDGRRSPWPSKKVSDLTVPKGVCLRDGMRRGCTVALDAEPSSLQVCTPTRSSLASFRKR